MGGSIQLRGPRELIRFVILFIICSYGANGEDSTLLWDYRFEPGDITGTSLKNYVSGGASATLSGLPTLRIDSPSVNGGSSMYIGTQGQ